MQEETMSAAETLVDILREMLGADECVEIVEDSGGVLRLNVWIADGDEDTQLMVIVTPVVSQLPTPEPEYANVASLVDRRSAQHPSRT